MKDYFTCLIIVWLAVLINNFLVKKLDLSCKNYYMFYSIIIALFYTIVTTIYTFM